MKEKVDGGRGRCDDDPGVLPVGVVVVAPGASGARKSKLKRGFSDEPEVLADAAGAFGGVEGGRAGVMAARHSRASEPPGASEDVAIGGRAEEGKARSNSKSTCDRSIYLQAAKTASKTPMRQARNVGRQSLNHLSRDSAGHQLCRNYTVVLCSVANRHPSAEYLLNSSPQIALHDIYIQSLDQTGGVSCDGITNTAPPRIVQLIGPTMQHSLWWLPLQEAVGQPDMQHAACTNTQPVIGVYLQLRGRLLCLGQ